MAEHTTLVYSEGVGDLFDFEALKPGELQQQIVNLNIPSIIRNSNEFQKRIESEVNLSNLEPDIREAIEQSIAMEEIEKAYIRLYVSKLKNKTNHQN